MAAQQSTISILDTAVAFQETTELERSEVDIPDSMVDFFQADIVAGTKGRDIDQSCCQRMPPLALTKRTSKRSWYSSRSFASAIRGRSTLRLADSLRLLLSSRNIGPTNLDLKSGSKKGAS
jgi:hypothetical protein